MNNNSKEILVLSICFLPNIGGVETHLKDLTNELVKKQWKVKVLTYQPLNTAVIGKWIEKQNNIIIFRLPIIRGLFYRLIKYPLLELMFLAPMQIIALPLLLIIYPKISIINSQGLVSGFSAVIWSKLFNKKNVIALQSIYNFPEKGLFTYFCKLIFNGSDHILVQSEASKKEVMELGIKEQKISVFTHWEDIMVFKPIDKNKAKEIIGINKVFTVSFFGRLVDIKGVNELLDSIAFINPKVTLLIYGEGPLEEKVKQTEKKFKNLIYKGVIPPSDLPLAYSASDVVIMPSTHEEGFGRVAVEALLCKTPVIASNRGQLPSIVNKNVGIIINVTPKNIADAINQLYTDKDLLSKLTLNSRKWAAGKYSSKNAKKIISVFNNLTSNKSSNKIA